ncbi:MAG: PExPT-CTERM protein [Terracidiphilus sp.]|jgi:XrtJ-associated TM-motif-TM protein
MQKWSYVIVAAAVLFAIAVPLRAQNGCVDSPEGPTMVLGLVGGAGALAAGLWRSRGRKQ